jgi:hypothetical protein
MATKEQRAAALRITANRPGAADIEAMENRVRRLELLYRGARRDDPHNTMRGLYSGLGQPSPF